MSEPSWKCSRCGWETNDLPANNKCARCMTWLEAVPCIPALPGVTVNEPPSSGTVGTTGSFSYYYKPPERSPADVIVRQTVELGSVRGDGETSCTIRGGAGMFVGTLPKGLWRLYLERVE